MVEILSILREAGISHRNIKMENLLVRGSVLYLINFEWATPEGVEMFSDVITKQVIGEGGNWDNEWAILRLASRIKQTLV